MKQILLTLLVAMISLSIDAQTVGYMGKIDEYKLQGSWKVDSSDGSIVALDGVPSYFTLSGLGGGNLTGINTDARIADWFISNGNKLHWHLTDGNSVYFIIMDYDMESNTISLMTFDDKCHITAHMWQDVNGIKTVKSNNTTNAKKYNLQGVEVEKPQGVYIQRGNKYISK